MRDGTQPGDGRRGEEDRNSSEEKKQSPGGGGGRERCKKGDTVRLRHKVMKIHHSRERSRAKGT